MAVEEVTAEELKKMRDDGVDFFLLDVREQSEYDSCNLNGTLIPIATLEDRLDEIPQDKIIVVHCKYGGRSSKAAKFLSESGFSDVKNLTGGIMAWVERIDPSLKGY